MLPTISRLFEVQLWFYYDGRFADLAKVVDRCDTCLALGSLAAREAISFSIC